MTKVVHVMTPSLFGFERIKAIALAVTDRARAEAFYGETLGLSPAFEGDQQVGYYLGQTILMLKENWYRHAAALIGKSAGIDITILCGSYEGHDAFAGQTVTPIDQDDEGSGHYETLEAALWQEIHDCIGTYVDEKGE